MTVWKDTRVLAKAAAKAAVQLIKGTDADDHRFGAERLEEGAGVHHPAGRAHKANWTKIYTSGFLKKSDVCIGHVHEVLQVDS